MPRRRKRTFPGISAILLIVVPLLIFMLMLLGQQPAAPAQTGQARFPNATAVQFLPMLAQPSDSTDQEQNSTTVVTVTQQAPEQNEATSVKQTVPRRPLEPQRFDTPELQDQLKRLEDSPQSFARLHNPKFSPFSDRYIVSTLVDLQPYGLWLGSASAGIERTLLPDQRVYYDWAFDDQHILYTSWPDAPKEPLAPPPVSLVPITLLNLENGEQKEIGLTTQFWNIQAVATGDIAFLNQDVLHIVNPIEGTERQIASIFTIGHPPAPPTEVPPPTTSEVIPEYLQATPTPADNASLPVPTPIPTLTFSQHKPKNEVPFCHSPDGRKVLLHQIANGHGALVLVDIATQTARLLTDQARNAWSPFGWSPDGRQVAYATIAEETWTPELWLVDVEGNAPPRQLAKEDGRGRYESVTWHPNDQDILHVFTPMGTNSSQRAEYRVVSREGGTPYTLFADGSALYLFDKGTGIVFFREQDAHGMIEFSQWIVDLTK